MALLCLCVCVARARDCGAWLQRSLSDGVDAYARGQLAGRSMCRVEVRRRWRGHARLSGSSGAKKRRSDVWPEAPREWPSAQFKRPEAGARGRRRGRRHIRHLQVDPAVAIGARESFWSLGRVCVCCARHRARSLFAPASALVTHDTTHVTTWTRSTIWTRTWTRCRGERASATYRAMAVASACVFCVWMALGGERSTTPSARASTHNNNNDRTGA